MQERNTTDIGLPSLLSRRMAAQHLGVSLRTIDNRLAAGELPHVRLGHLIRFKADDIADYIERHRVAGKFEAAK